MKPKLTILTAVVAVCLVHLSCGECSRKIDCAAFKDTALTAWFGYAAGERLRFQNSAGQTMNFLIAKDSASPAYQARSSTGRPLSCNASKYIESAEKDSFQKPRFWLELEVVKPEAGSEVKSAIARLLGTSIYFRNLDNTGFTIVSIDGQNTSPEKFANLNIGNRNFDEVYLVTRDTVAQKRAGIYKVCFGRSKGIVAFAEYPSLQTWVKQ